jgi:sporulation protein YlmC with PRC-barrel domain
MLLGKDLHGRAVVDVDGAEKLGKVDDLILDPRQGRLAGLVVSESTALLGRAGVPVVLPASAIQAIGPDVVTVRRGASDENGSALETLPHWSKLTGRKVVSQSGAVLGSIEDVVFDPADGRIRGYPLRAPGPGGGLDALLGGQAQRAPYIRPDTDLRVGEDLVVVPDDAVVRDEPGTADSAPARAVEQPTTEPSPAPTREERRADADRRVREAQTLLGADVPEQGPTRGGSR